MKDFCIVIPAYKEELDIIERISLKRLYDVIGNKKYDVILLTHKDLKIDNYVNIYPSLKFAYLDKKYFTGIQSYSFMMISTWFYDLFSDYNYIYIYQLDCYLFKDELQYWVDQRYDYIGAPIFCPTAGWRIKQNDGSLTPKVGNGGFSLRRISTFKDLCNYIEKVFKKYMHCVDVEDIFICDTISRYYKMFIPDYKVAMRFSWDMNPDIIYDYIGYRMFPMGAHAIGKNIRFYKDFIEEFKNVDVINYCEDKYMDFFTKYYTDNYRSTFYKEYAKLVL